MDPLFTTKKIKLKKKSISKKTFNTTVKMKQKTRNLQEVSMKFFVFKFY